ncbi:MAG: hypothetical protein WD801_16410 [Gemmatimonadaceae bacterium]
MRTHIVMHEHTQGTEDPQFSAQGLAEWSEHVEHVLRGIAHALNNRASAISAVIELTRDPEDDPEVTQSILATELERLTELSSVVRCIGMPRGGSEAFAPNDAVPEALTVLKLHAEQRERVIMIDAQGAPPTRVPRWMFVRALIALGATAAPDGDRAATTRLTVVEDGEWLVARAAGNGGACSRYAGELARAMGGGPLEGGGQCGFRIPTLASLRRREGR